MNEHFICEIDWTKSDTNKNIFIERTNIGDKNTANEWLKLFSSFSNTNWIVNYELASPQKKDQWVRLYRRNILYRNNETNNYAEASIRIIKDILLNRTKAYNTVALVDFIVSVGEEYFTLRLLDHAHDRNTKTHRLYSKLCSKTVNITIEDVKQIDEHTYSIPSGSDKQTLYTINTEFGVCSCKDGCAGAFCKHQAWVHDKLKVQLPNAPAVTLEERYSLGVLALGEKCPEPNFFQGLKENLPEILSYEILTTSIITETGSSENSSANLNMEQTSSQLNSENKFDRLNNYDNDNEVVHTVLEEWSRLQNMIPSLPSSILQNLSSRLKNIHNSEQFIGFVHSVNKTAANINRRKGKIRVQPTSISRRKEGVTRGSKRISAGRKPNGMIMKTKVKRPNNLGKNISKNLLNSKSHGSGH
ncbi:hypothetical protein ACI65C_013452 [Semiaphis heraclei]